VHSWHNPGFNSKFLWAEKFQYVDRRWKDASTPGWMNDKDQRRFLFDRWLNRPTKAKMLYWKMKKLSLLTTIVIPL